MKSYHYYWLFALALAYPANVSLGYDWPQWRGPLGNGISQEKTWRFDFKKPTILWQKALGVGCASVTVMGDRVYSGGWRKGQDTIYCLDARSGELIWTYSYEIARYNKMHEGGLGATPAVDGQRVYVISREADLFCLDAETGKLLWSKKLKDEFGLKIPDWGFTGSPVVHEDRLYVDVGRIVCFYKATGELDWKTKDYGAAYSTPAIFEIEGRPMLAAFPRSGLVLLDRADGRELAEHLWQTSYGVNAATPVVVDRSLFIASGYGTGCAMLRFADGRLQVEWENKRMKCQMATPVWLGSYIYGFDEKVLRCLDASTGKEEWKNPGFGRGTLMVADGKLIVLSETGELVIADASPQGFRAHTNVKLLETSHTWVVPVLANGKIFCRSAEGQLVCVDVSQ